MRIKGEDVIFYGTMIGIVVVSIVVAVAVALIGRGVL